jgi:hypothetical protein
MHQGYVAFHSARHQAVSALVYCDWGGEGVLDGVETALQMPGPHGVAGHALQLSLLWSLRYGWDRVAVFSVPVPGLRPGMSQAEEYQLSVEYLRQKVEADFQYHLVDLDEFLVINKNWTHRLGRGDAESAAAPDRPGD